MNKLQYIFNNDGVVFFINNAPKKVLKTDKKYAQILDCFNLPIEDQFDAVQNIFKAKEIQTTFVKEGFDVTPEKVTYKGKELPRPLAIKIRSLHKEGLPLNLFEKFWENLEQNPSFSVVNDIGFFDFLDYRELPLTTDGFFLAYKGIQSNNFSVMGNTTTKVISGKVDSTGHIHNGIGETIEIVRNQISDDRNEHCWRFALHLGSLDYARGWGQKVVVVKVNPRDVVCVPNDCNCQKLRVCKYEVIADYVEEIVAPVTDVKGEPIFSEDTKKTIQSSQDRSDFIVKVGNYVFKQLTDNYNVSVRKIQNSFSPNHPSREQIIDAITELGYSWYNSDKGPMVGAEEVEY
jgi:hypothetical protein